MSDDRLLARMIHERFCCNRRSASTTSLRPAGSPLGPSPYCTSTRRVFWAPRAGLATQLSAFATNRHESCGSALRFPVALVLSIVCLAVPAWADFQAGMDAYNRGDYATALREWRPLAEQGDARAQFYLGLSYENGDGVPRDHANARQWYEKAAAQGDAKAQLYLGMQSSFGEGGPVDVVQAYMWYSLAAGNGNVHAPGYRDDLTRQMTSIQITEAKKRAREWKPKDK